MRHPTPAEAPQRTVLFRARQVAMVLAIAVLFALALTILYVTRRVITWILIALFLALALNPAVGFFERRGLRRGLAAGLVFLLAVCALVAIGFALIPPLVRQIGDLIDAAPHIVSQLTKGRGPLGFLERDYHVVERVREAIGKGGAASKVAALTGPIVNALQTFATAVVATVTIAFLTLFMLLEGPAWIERILGAVPPAARPAVERATVGIYRTVGGYVTGNILISVIAGTATTVVLLVLGVPYEYALGVVVAILDLIPLAGATIAAIIVSGVAFSQGLVTGGIVVGFFVVYQQFENHVLQPLIYGRTVQLSPLAVLIAVLIGGDLLGVIGALGAIPVAGSLQIVWREFFRYRRERAAEELAEGTPPSGLPP